MASTAGDGQGIPSSTAAPASVFLDGDHPLFHSPSSSAFLDDQTAASGFHLPSGCFTTATAQDPSSPSPAAARKQPPRKRLRPSSRPPTTVLTTDASNFRSMVQEFTGFPAPRPFAGPPPPHLRHGGVLLGADPSSPATAVRHLLRPSHLMLPLASDASLPSCTTSSSVLDQELALFAKNNAMPTAAAGAATPRPSSSSDLYSSYGDPMLAGAVPFDDGFEATAAAEGERTGLGHGLFSSSLHAGDWYPRC